jgi:hypothetical protein
MGRVAEDNLWYKGKSEILTEFQKGTKAILAAVGSRNFSSMPGFAIEALTDSEMDAKFKLTDYNQKIMSDAIDRELKALGLQNDIALKQAMMAWETEKQVLFSDLQKEFADAELVRSLQEEGIASLMIDQEMREVAILVLKVAIEVEIEDIKRQKEEVDLLALPYEEQLAAARLATATRKLDVIPYILAALASQSAVIVKELADVIPAREEKANYDKEVADRTLSDILPKMEEKTAARGALTTAEAELIAPIIEKADKTVILTTKEAELLAPMTEKAVAITNLTTAQATLLPKMIDKAAATTELTTVETGLIEPQTRKAVALTERTAEKVTLLGPMTEKAAAATDLTAKQNELLDPMARKAAATAALTVELQTLLDPLRLKAQANHDLADEMMAQLANHILLAQEKVTLAGEKIVRMQKELSLMGKEQILDARKITIELNRAELELKRAEARLEIAEALRTQLGLIRTAMTAESEAETTFINVEGANRVAVRKSQLDNVKSKEFEARKVDILSQISTVISIGNADKAHSIKMADITGKATITEKLIHLLQ